MAEIGRCLGFHYSRIHRIVREAESAKGETWLQSELEG